MITLHERPTGPWDIHYRGTRGPRGCTVVKVIGSTARQLDWRLDLANRSPTGLEWGYGGSGPAQLSIALLADALEQDELALKFADRFKRDVIAIIGGNGFQVRRATLLALIAEWTRQERPWIRRENSL